MRTKTLIVLVSVLAPSFAAHAAGSPISAIEVELCRAPIDAAKRSWDQEKRKFDSGFSDLEKFGAKFTKENTKVINDIAVLDAQLQKLNATASIPMGRLEELTRNIIEQAQNRIGGEDSTHLSEVASSLSKSPTSVGLVYDNGHLVIGLCVGSGKVDGNGRPDRASCAMRAPGYQRLMNHERYRLSGYDSVNEVVESAFVAGQFHSGAHTACKAVYEQLNREAEKAQALKNAPILCKGPEDFFRDRHAETASWVAEQKVLLADSVRKAYKGIKPADLQKLKALVARHKYANSQYQNYTEERLGAAWNRKQDQRLSDAEDAARTKVDLFFRTELKISLPENVVGPCPAHYTRSWNGKSCYRADPQSDQETDPLNALAYSTTENRAKDGSLERGIRGCSMQRSGIAQITEIQVCTRIDVLTGKSETTVSSSIRGGGVSGDDLAKSLDGKGADPTPFVKGSLRANGAVTCADWIESRSAKPADESRSTASADSVSRGDGPVASLGSGSGPTASSGQ